VHYERTVGLRSPTSWPLLLRRSLHIMRRKSTLLTPGTRGLHSFTVQLNLSTIGTDAWGKLGHVADKPAQVELKWERV